MKGKNSMEFQKFKDKIKEIVSEKLGAHMDIYMQRIDKTNGIVWEALVIRRKGSEAAPTFYMEPLYEAYENGDASLESIAETICTQCGQDKPGVSFDTESLLCFEAVRDKIIFRIVNLQKNIGMLEDMPHGTFLDFAVIYCVLLEDAGKKTMGTIMIKNSHLAAWGVDEGQVESYAKKNTPVILGSRLMPMSSIFEEICPGISGTTCSTGVPETDEIYVLSNRCKLYGASCILYPNLLGQVAEKLGSDFYIIPKVIKGRPVFFDPPNVKDAKNLLMGHLAKNKPEIPFTGAVELTVLWLFPKGKSHKHGEWRKTRPDTDNLQKLLKDCMTQVGFWKDDAQVVSEKVQKRWSDEPTGIYVEIKELEVVMDGKST